MVPNSNHGLDSLLVHILLLTTYVWYLKLLVMALLNTGSFYPETDLSNYIEQD